MFVTSSFVFFFNDTATTEIYTLSLHDALPIFILFVELAISHLSAVPRQDDLVGIDPHRAAAGRSACGVVTRHRFVARDRKSTRLNSSHGYISYAVFCLKKKKKINTQTLLIQLI